jgi:hypothetical protein
MDFVVHHIICPLPLIFVVLGHTSAAAKVIKPLPRFSYLRLNRNLSVDGSLFGPGDAFVHALTRFRWLYIGMCAGNV